MRKEKIEEYLIELYEELKKVNQMSEQAVIEAYNTEEKAEIVELINEEIRSYEDELEEIERIEALSEDDGMNYIRLQEVQGLPVIAW